MAESIPSGFQVNRTLGLALSLYVQRRKVLSRARRQEISRHLGEPLCRRFNLPPDTDHDLLLCGLYQKAFLGSRVSRKRQVWHESLGTAGIAAAALAGVGAALRGHGRPGGARFRRPRMFPASPICIARPVPTWPWPTPINCRRRRSSISINSWAGPTINSIAMNRRTTGGWFQELFVNVPQRLFADGCLRLAFAMFWGVFLLCMFLAWRDPDFAPRIVGKERS